MQFGLAAEHEEAKEALAHWMSEVCPEVSCLGRPRCCGHAGGRCLKSKDPGSPLFGGVHV